MKIHHLSCGSFCPATIPILNPKPLEACCHCLLLESSDGLVLIDSGYSMADVSSPRERLGLSPLIIGAKLKDEQTALMQVKRLGFKPEDVRHIVLTHLDPDHAGGIEDFPHAQVHLFAEEYHLVKALSQHPGKWRTRFRPQNWPRHVHWNFYSTKGEQWRSLNSVRTLKNIKEDILLIPLAGHSPGHCGVAIENEKNWLLHAGDAYFQRTEISDNWVNFPMNLQIYESLLAFNNRERLENQKLLRNFKIKNSDVDIFCSHDKEEFKKFS